MLDLARYITQEKVAEGSLLSNPVSLNRKTNEENQYEMHIT